jgi:hypothetical protein
MAANCDHIPCLIAMRHLKADQPPSHEPQDPMGRVADDEHQQLKPQPELYDYENLELACREVVSDALPAESFRKDTIDSPLSAHYVHSATSSLIGIGSGTQAASSDLSQSLFRFSLSSDTGDLGRASPLDLSPTFSNDWIKDVGRQAAAADDASVQGAPASERRNLLKAQRQMKHVSKRDSPKLKKAFVRMCLKAAMHTLANESPLVPFIECTSSHRLHTQA